MAATLWFKDWFNSPYYHQLYFQRDEEEAAAFIYLLLHHLKPSAEARMLDVACGRGRHSKILAGKGYDVSGMDISAESIVFAKQFETEKLRICGFLFGLIILIMPLISLPASVISEPNENITTLFVPLHIR
jgi:SAM-dependent methyltransferase